MANSVSATSCKANYFVSFNDANFADKAEKIFRQVLEPLYGDQTKALRQIHQNQDREGYLYLMDHEPVGILVYKTKGSNEFANLGVENSLEIKTLFVINSEKNSGKGIGSDLLKRVENKAREELFPSVHVTVSETKKDSLHFFSKKGFQIVQTWDGKYVENTKEHLLNKKY
jgi:L-amino acid N-acyltransferase YncA